MPNVILKGLVKRPPVILNGFNFLKDTTSALASDAIHSHWVALGGTPGNAISNVEKIGKGYRIRYERGAIYYKDKKAAWVYGAINQRYEELGNASSWLGFPTADEASFSEGGRVSTFERGAIYWWPDVGAIELNDVVVQYAGMICFEETDWDQMSDSDEPYAVLGVVSPVGNTTTTKSQVYEDVDGGEGRSEVLEIYRGKPYGMSITAAAIEHDEDDPEKYKKEMNAAVLTAAGALTTAVGALTGPAVALVAGPLLISLAPAVAGALHNLLNLGDDTLGVVTIPVSAKQMIVLAARTTATSDNGVTFKLQSPEMNGHGSHYKIYFNFLPV